MSYRFCSIDRVSEVCQLYTFGKKYVWILKWTFGKRRIIMKWRSGSIYSAKPMVTWIRVLCLNDIDLIFHLISTLEINFRPYVEWLIQIFFELHLYSEFLCKFIGCTCTLSEILHTKTYLCHQYILYEMTQT